MALKKILYRPLQESQAEVSGMMLALARIAHRLSAKAVIRGSHEAALAEAQGGRLARTDAEGHLESITEARASIHNSYVKFTHELDYVAKSNHSVYLRLKHATGPLMAAALRAERLVDRTAMIASRLASACPDRLKNVHLVAGQRTVESLISTQLLSWNQSHSGEQLNLLPAMSFPTDVGLYTAAIAGLPIDPKSAKVLIAPQLQQLKDVELQASPIVKESSRQNLSMISRPMQFVIDYGRGLVDMDAKDVRGHIERLVSQSS